MIAAMMSGYLLEPVIKARKFRAESAGNDVMVKQHLFTECEHALTAAQESLSDYIIWRNAEEARRYDSLTNTQLDVAGLDDFKHEILALRHKEASYEEALLEAEKNLKAADEALAKAREAHRKALGDLNKIEEHRKVWQVQQQKEEERKAEWEMEDVRTANDPTIISHD